MVSKNMISNRTIFSRVLLISLICCILIADLECKRHSKAEKKFSEEDSSSFSNNENGDQLGSDENNQERENEQHPRSRKENSKSIYSTISDQRNIKETDFSFEDTNSNYPQDVETDSDKSADTTMREDSNVEGKQFKPKYLDDEDVYKTFERKSYSSNPENKNDISTESRRTLTEEDFTSQESEATSKSKESEINELKVGEKRDKQGKDRSEPSDSKSNYYENDVDKTKRSRDKTGIKNEYNKNSRDKTGREYKYNENSSDKTGREYKYNENSSDKTGREYKYNENSSDKTGREYKYNENSRDKTGSENEYNKNSRDKTRREYKYNENSSDKTGSENEYNEKSSISMSKHFNGELKYQGDSSSKQKHTLTEGSSGASGNAGSGRKHSKDDRSQTNNIETSEPIVFTPNNNVDYDNNVLYSEKAVLSTIVSSTKYQTSILNMLSTTTTNKPSKSSTGIINARPDKEEETVDTLNTAPGIIIKQPYTGRKKCIEKTPPCCIPGQIDINLGTINYKARVKGELDGVSATVSTKSQRANKRCSNGAVIKVSFDPMGNEGCFGCTKGPFCGRRLLQLDLDLSRNMRRDTLLYITDSPSKDGGAIVHAVFPHVTIYPHNSAENSSSHVMIMGVTNSRTNKMTVYIGNQFMRMTNDNRLDENFCMNDLFHLNGQFDPDGISPNEITIGINRQIPQNDEERSFGVCSASLKWTCPWQET